MDHVEVGPWELVPVPKQGPRQYVISRDFCGSCMSHKSILNLGQQLWLKLK